MTLRKVKGKFEPVVEYVEDKDKPPKSFWEVLFGSYRAVTVGYRFCSVRDRQEGYYNPKQYRRLLKAQKNEPQVVMIDKDENKRWWMFQDEFYCEDEGLTEIEVKALILDRKRKRKNRVQKAIANLALSEGEAEPTSPKREPIPEDVKILVWQRDGGRCVKCGSRKNLEFDHIIPLSKGGSNSARNLQLLCQDCNRSKGGDLV